MSDDSSKALPPAPAPTSSSVEAPAPVADWEAGDIMHRGTGGGSRGTNASSVAVELGNVDTADAREASVVVEQPADSSERVDATRVVVDDTYDDMEALNPERELTEQEQILLSYETYGDMEALKAMRFVSRGVSKVTPQFVKTGVSSAINVTESVLHSTVDATKNAAEKTASAVPQPIGKAVHATTEAVGNVMNFAANGVTSIASTTANILEACPDMMINFIPDSFMSKETKHLVFVDFNNTLHSFFHTNLLSMPYLFNEAGLVMGIVITIFVAIISELAVETFYRVKYKFITDPKKQKVWVYGDLPRMMWGDWYPTLNILHGLLHLIGFQVYAAGNFKVVLRESFGYTDATGVKMLSCIVPSMCALPLIFLKQCKHQRPLAITSNFLTFLAAGILLFNFNWNTVAGDVDYFSESYDRLGVALGVAVYIFSGIGSTLPVERTMDPLMYISLLRKAVIGSSVVLLLFGIVGYLSYGEGTCSIIVLSLPDSPQKSAVALILFFASIAIIPLQTFPFTELIDRRFLGLRSIPPYGHWKANGQRFFVLCFGGAVAYFVPFYGLISAVGGSFTCVILSLIVPFALDYTLNGGFTKGFLNWPFARLAIIGGFGVFVLIVSLSATFYDIAVKITSTSTHVCN